MLTPRRCTLGAACVVAALLTVGPVSAQETGKLLPADTDIILTVNFRQFLKDHQNNEAFRHFLDPLRSAAKADDGGLDPTRDVDRITCGFTKGDRGSVVVVEGRFRRDELRAAVEKLAKEHFGSFTIIKMRGRELWQVPVHGVHLVLLDANTLAITTGDRSMDAMGALLARHADQKQGELSAGLRALLDRCRKDHAALLVNRVDFLIAEAARRWPIRDGIARSVAKQITAVIQQSAGNVSAAGVGLRVGENGLKLRFDLETKDPESARRTRALIQAGNLWTALALQTMDNELARQWAGILRKERFEVHDASLAVHAYVPYEFLHQLVHALMEASTRQVTSIPIWGLPGTSPDALAVGEVRDVAYRNGPQSDPYRHRLDLFYPKGKKGFPVIVLVHGGGWALGDNRCFGLYTSVGQFLASQGVGVVMPNYRLSPRVKHPEHVRDVARAVAWTRAHIAEYGGDPGRIFLMGHSAGGHLVALLATDETYLRAEGLKTADVKGVIASSGVYDIPAGAVAITLGGSGPTACGLDQHFPLRGDSGAWLNGFVPAFPLAVNIYSPPFGEDLKDRERASPLKHVRPGLPPFLILVAEKDLPTLAGMAEVFHRALREAGCDAQLLRLDRRNHNSGVFSVIRPEDPAARAILEFVKKK
jgi:acetyl esterase/lipase